MYLSRNLLSGPAICYELDDRGSIPRRAECLSSPHIIPALSPPHSRTRWVPDRGVKLAAHSRPYLLAFWAWSANLYWMFTRHCNNLQYDANKLSPPHATEFLRKLSSVWAHALKRVRQPFPRPKILK
jgi:hypothetical protein